MFTRARAHMFVQLATETPKLNNVEERGCNFMSEASFPSRKRFKLFNKTEF
jgi:hypothetical protein